mgnify:CR=1 FL=1
MQEDINKDGSSIYIVSKNVKIPYSFYNVDYFNDILNYTLNGTTYNIRIPHTLLTQLLLELQYQLFVNQPEAMGCL